MKAVDCDGFATMRPPLDCSSFGKHRVRKFGEKQVEKERFVMKINDEILDRLGTYFVYHAVYDNYGITFENFVERWIRGILEV
ncbi:hypothetical protein [Lysinibacillus fusiformis]|nr:hypothetical protein [Lysinibacillus fusiformis]MCR8853148.1 hypothetical protein [Lysinibacillus fusiformis]